MKPAALDIPGLLAQLARHGDRRALSFYRGKALSGGLTYAELVAKVEALAGGLHGKLGVCPGDRVAILAPNRLEVPVLVLALMRLGAVVVPLNPASAVEDWAFILGHSGARGVCATSELLERVPAGTLSGFRLRMEEAFVLEGAAGEIPPHLGEAAAAILYTSGTTGHPKGVALRQRNLVSNAWSMAQHFGLDASTQLAVLPLYHAHAFGFGLMTALTTGGHLVFTERLEPFTWAEVIRAESVAVTSAVPTMLPMLLAAGVKREKVPTLRHIMVSSAPLPQDLARDFEARTGIPLVLGWGLSEYTNFACCVPPQLDAGGRAQLMLSLEEVPSIGPALEGTEVRVVGGSGAPAGPGERGELMVRGHSTMLGYFEDPENTARAIDSDGWLHTGDEGLFRMHAGRPVFFVTGRLKEVIIRDAEKYSPLRIERRITDAVPELSGQLVVLGFSHKEHGEEVGAYVEGAPDEALRARLTAAIDALSVAERPKVVLYGTRPVPRTHTGKIQRRKMQGWFAPWQAHRGLLVFAEVG